MTRKSEFSSEEWELILQGPPTAGVMVVTAERGGAFRETLALTKSYVEARRHHGESELLDEIVSAKPQLDHTHYATPEELREHGLQHLRDAVALLEQKSNPEELDAYKRFVINLAASVAGAHREHSVAISDKEQTVLDEIAKTLGVDATQ
jgi:predicted house-cleaning noncanonical NTP pyrophosphatase (MazG superfamily)